MHSQELNNLNIMECALLVFNRSNALSIRSASSLHSFSATYPAGFFFDYTGRSDAKKLRC
jgi:hypothetical protein